MHHSVHVITQPHIHVDLTEPVCSRLMYHKTSWVRVGLYPTCTLEFDPLYFSNLQIDGNTLSYVYRRDR